MFNALKSKRLWTGAAIIAAVAFLLAVGANQAVRVLLVLPDDAEMPDAPLVADLGDGETERPDHRPSNRKPTKSSYKDPIVKRSIFDSTKVGLEIVDDEVTYDGSEGVATDMDVVLLATLVAKTAEYSSALISETGKGSKAYGFAEGDTLFGEAEIVRIEQRRVIIIRDGRTEYIEMDGEKEVARGGKKTKKTDDEEGITKDGEKIIVERALVDDALANVESLATKIRVVPHKGSDGSVDGYRLSAIRRGSLFDKLGIKNGDVVHAVNGMPLTSMDGAMSAFQSLQSEAEFTFDVTRRNKKSTFEYEIR